MARALPHPPSIAFAIRHAGSRRRCGGVAILLALLTAALPAEAEEKGPRSPDRAAGPDGSWVEHSLRSGAGRRVDITFDPQADITDWRSFTIVQPPPERREGIAAAERDALLRSTIGVALAVAGFVYEEGGDVDFVVEYRFAHPGEPPSGTTSWAVGKQTNWLEIGLRRPGDLQSVWRGRVHGVLRKKRNQGQQDEDARLRFHAAAEAIIDTFVETQGGSR